MTTSFRRPPVLCPACHKPIVPPRGSRSRFVEMFICADCGVREAMDGDFWKEQRLKSPPLPQPKDWDPWNE
jgi:RNase P subunit RPR2